MRLNLVCPECERLGRRAQLVRDLEFACAGFASGVGLFFALQTMDGSQLGPIQYAFGGFLGAAAASTLLKDS